MAREFFNVTINYKQVLSNFDVYAATGGEYRAIAKQFTTTADSHGQITIDLSAVVDNAEVNGIVHWIRLELDATTSLEARPEPGAISLSSPRFWPLRDPVLIRRGQTLDVAVTHDSRRLTIWPIRLP